MLNFLIVTPHHSVFETVSSSQSKGTTNCLLQLLTVCHLKSFPFLKVFQVWSCNLWSEYFFANVFVIGCIGYWVVMVVNLHRRRVEFGCKSFCTSAFLTTSLLCVNLLWISLWKLFRSTIIIVWQIIIMIFIIICHWHA